MELMLSVPLSLLLAHFVGDWLLQSDWMALNKGKWWHDLEGYWALLVHVSVANLTLALWAFFCYQGQHVALWGMSNFTLHFLTDAITSQFTSKWWFFRWIPGPWVKTWDEGRATFTRDDLWTFGTGIGNRHWFFVTIGFDQFLHFAAFAITLWWLK